MRALRMLDGLTLWHQDLPKLSLYKKIGGAVRARALSLSRVLEVDQRSSTMHILLDMCILQLSVKHAVPSSAAIPQCNLRRHAIGSKQTALPKLKW